MSSQLACDAQAVAIRLSPAQQAALEALRSTRRRLLLKCNPRLLRQIDHQQSQTHNAQ